LEGYVIVSSGQRTKEKKRIVLTSWKKLALPKENGGRELKKPFIFSKALAAKNVWRLYKV
jgi:hypothetical protein